MPIACQEPGRLLMLLELAAERGDEPEPGGEAPSTPWGSTDILSAMNRATVRAGSVAPCAVPPGRRLGRYHLIRRLGVGSEGEVWKAVHISGGLKAVALKVLRPDLSEDPARRAAFLRAAQRARRLVATSLLPTLDAGEEEGFVYQAMPLVDGPTLAAAILERKETRAMVEGDWWITLDNVAYARAVTRLFSHLARAVDAAHTSGVAHRDIKPTNILLDRAHPGRAFLGDFGIGSDLDAQDPDPMAAGSGTPMYMPPERLLGRPSDAVLGDIFALGVALYEALVLTHPRPVPEGLPRSCLPTFLAAINPAPPRVVCPWLPRRLEAVVLRAIARDPSRRHPSAASLADDLNAACPAWSVPPRGVSR